MSPLLIINNYSLNQVNSGRIFTDMRSMEVNILKPLFAEIEENNCISIYKLGDSRKLSKSIQFDLF